MKQGCKEVTHSVRCCMSTDEVIYTLRAENAKLREALTVIEKFVRTEYVEGEKPFQIAVVAKVALKT